LNPTEDRILRISDADKTILVFQWPVQTLLVLLKPIQRHYSCAEAKTNELVPAANCQDWNSSGMDKLAEAFNDSRIVVIEVAQRAAKHNRIRLEIFGCDADRCQVR
jgi:hypothetical protein